MRKRGDVSDATEAHRRKPVEFQREPNLVHRLYDRSKACLLSDERCQSTRSERSCFHLYHSLDNTGRLRGHGSR